MIVVEMDKNRENAFDLNCCIAAMKRFHIKSPVNENDNMKTDSIKRESKNKSTQTMNSLTELRMDTVWTAPQVVSIDIVCNIRKIHIIDIIQVGNASFDCLM